MNNNGNNDKGLDDKINLSNGAICNVEKKNKSKYTLAIILCIIIFVITNIVSFIVGLSFYFASSGIKTLSEDVKDYRKIFLVKNVLEKTFNGEINKNVLVDEAIKGMVNSLGDPYTVYMNKKEFEDFNLRNNGGYVGIGIQVAYKENKIVIVTVFDDSPAYNSGIYPGDVILKVSDQDADDLDKTISLIKGSEGSSVSLKVERNGEILDFNVQRGKIVIKNVEYSKIDDKLGYIKMNSFDENSSKEIRKALEELKVKGLIFDLRGNPGGLLNECADIVSEFLSEGSVIVSTDDKFGNNEVVNATKGIAEDVELVILGDSGSASASEVLIGALRDHNRAVFVGEKTFGKGLVQRVFELGDGTGFKVTISKYYTPNKEYINGIGIKPDFEVKYSQDDYIKNREQAKGDVDELRKLDPQYQKALEILREKVNN